MRPPSFLLPMLAISVGLVAVTQSVSAYRLLDRQWSGGGDIVLDLQLGESGTLLDGSASWNACAAAALDDWNLFLEGTGTRLRATRGVAGSPGPLDSVNSVYWSNQILGSPLGTRVLALTSSVVSTGASGNTTIMEVDVIFNAGRPFDCYRTGALANDGSADLKRVALHAFGHVIGLAHPDEATPPQMADPIMASMISDTDSLQADDVQGARMRLGMAVAPVIPFPPRNEALDFFLRLEAEYRDTLGRQQNNEGFVDPEGSAVWFPEWLRYVLNECAADEATSRVLMQIRGQGIQPVCGTVPPGVITFPPRNLSLDFLNTLDAFYRDELNRLPLLSYIDLEGKAVWLQEYLRYRVNGCSDAQATDRVLTQIRGGGIIGVCTGSSGCSVSATPRSAGATASGAVTNSDCEAPASPSPSPAPSPTASLLPKRVDVFGVTVHATAAVPDDKVLHAARVMAEYLDNDEDGTVDDPAVVASMTGAGAFLVMFADEAEEDAFSGTLPEGSGQNLYARETHPEGSVAAGEFDATLEEVLHLISHTGLASAYPAAFAETPASELTNAMDMARGGFFESIPASYPSDAWYTYSDSTCDYGCQATEYFYWALTSILGAQDYQGRFEEIQGEWKLNTCDLVASTDSTIFALLTDGRHRLPTRIPDGVYDALPLVLAP